ARAYHENTSTVVGRVIAWEDERGRLAVAGSMVPGLPETFVAQVAGAPVSVEQWPTMETNGRNTLTAAHLVVTPAWPVGTTGESGVTATTPASAGPRSSTGSGSTRRPWKGRTRRCRCTATSAACSSSSACSSTPSCRRAGARRPPSRSSRTRPCGCTGLSRSRPPWSTSEDRRRRPGVRLRAGSRYHDGGVADPARGGRAHRGRLRHGRDAEAGHRRGTRAPVPRAELPRPGERRHLQQRPAGARAGDHQAHVRREADVPALLPDRRPGPADRGRRLVPVHGRADQARAPAREARRAAVHLAAADQPRPVH